MSAPPTTLAPFGYGAIPPSVLLLKAAPRVFDLCQRQSYISIKDQMIRARLLSEWLASTGLLGSDYKTVIVIGAGVAGACVAALLAEHSTAVHVTLADERHDLFTAQEACDSRFVSLTQYDWPSRDFDLHEWPSAHSVLQTHTPIGSSFRLTIPSTPTRARDLVLQWRIDFAAFRARRSNLTVLLGKKAQLPSAIPSAGAVDISLSDTGSAAPPTTQAFDLVICAAGFGREAVPVVGGTRISTAFWDSDDYASPTVSHAGASFAIVGFGDGALQDFLRLACHTTFRSASEIFDAIEKGIAFASASPHPVAPTRVGGLGFIVVGPSITDAWHRLVRALADVDRQSVLAAPWDVDGDRATRDLQEDVERAVMSFVSSFRSAVNPIIDSVLRLPSDALKSITIVAPKPWPSKCYLLNRFLFTLIRERLTSAGSMRVPAYSFVRDTVDASRISATGGGYTLALSAPLTVDRIIWRGGIGGPKPVSVVEGMQVAIGRHALPFYPPDRFR